MNEHPQWSAWLAQMDTALDDFFTTRPGTDIAALDDPYSASGFAVLEQWITAEFAGLAVLLAPANSTVVDRCVRYVGETYRRTCEGEWINSPQAQPGSIRPAILLPWTRTPLDPQNQVGAAFSRLPARSPQGQMAGVLDTMTDNHTTWVELGRPTPEQYGQIVVERIVAETDGSEL
ncbi:hypothetical protein [Nocardia carnea]|uniref:hypothetical protein n=1 Tax=Nocardia carnea TaxID=37328 RepID=UPI002453B7C2|nr:hypothetical protein [Nocardia carnea]